MTDMVSALYNPTTGKIGCVLLQSAYGAEKRVSHLFDVADWELAPAEGQAIMQATLEQWRWLAGLEREQRVWRFHQTIKEANDGT